MLAAQFSLSALVVFQLVGELGLVLQADELGPHFVDGAELPHLQLLHGLVVTQQHGVLQVFLRLTLIQLLYWRKEIWQGKIMLNYKTFLVTKACNQFCIDMSVKNEQTDVQLSSHHSNLLSKISTYFSHKVLLYVVFGNEDAAFKAAALKL